MANHSEVYKNISHKGNMFMQINFYEYRHTNEWNRIENLEDLYIYDQLMSSQK